MTSLIEALETGDERELLTAMRDKIAEVIDEGVAARDLASLSRRLLDLAQEVRALDVAEDNPRGRALRAVQETRRDVRPNSDLKEGGRPWQK